MVGPTVPLVSSNLASCAYDPEAKALTIAFISGGVWTYQGVEQGVVDGLAQASSAGKFFHQRIRTQYPTTRG